MTMDSAMMRDAVRSHGWAATPLGSREDWPCALRAAVELILPNHFASIVLWGRDLIQIYNDGYRRIMADKHPAFLGRPTRECWPEVWHITAPIYARVWQGETVSREDSLYPLVRNGVLADAWFDLCYSPIRDDAGVVGGVLVTLIEVTAWHLAECERQLAQTALRSSRAWLSGHGRALQAALSGEQLEASLGALVDTVMQHLGEDVRAAFYGVDPDTRTMRHLVGMSAEHAMTPRGCDLDSGCPACGLGPDDAAIRITPDVTSAPGWEAWRDLARRFDYRGCWSFAIRSSAGEIAGAFVVYLREPREATPEESGLIELIGRTAAIILSRDAETAARRQMLRTLRASEERQAFLLRLSDAIRPLADPAAIKAMSMRLLGAQLGVTRAQYYEADPTGECLESQGGYADGGPPFVGSVRLRDFGEYVKEHFDARRTLVVADVAADPRVGADRLAAYAALGVRAFVGIPLVKDGRLVAALGLQQTEPRSWMAGEIAIAEETAERTWSAVERARAESALRVRDEKYRSLFESMDEGCCVMEVEYAADGSIAELYFREVNQAFERQGGFPGALGQPVSRFMPNLAPYWHDAHMHTMQTGQPTRVENFVVETGRWYSVQFARIGGAGSRWLAAVFQDVSDRKTTERATARLVAIVDSSDDAIIRKNLDGIIETWNTGAQRMFGYTADEVIGKPVTILMPPDRVDEEPGILARIRRGERIKHWETLRRCKDGTLLDVSLSVSPIFNRAGEVVAASKIARDISERKRAEVALRESAARLQRANRSKDEFIAMLSHELRNPLAPITTTLQLMKLRAPDVFTHEREVIQGQVAYLTSLVDDLLDVARIASGKVELKMEPLDVGELVAAAVETIQPAMEKHRQSLHVDVADGLMVEGDRRRLVQVLVNLLGNAAKYSLPDRKVRLDVSVRDDRVEFRVRDEGQGIAPELLPQVFELFRQGTQQLDRSRGGLGLGLAIVDNLVKLHGGSVGASSAGVGQGSEFAVRLPLARRGPAEYLRDSTRRAEASAPVSAGARTRVLIVDDYAVAAESMALLLEAMGYSTYVAYDGASALRATAEFSPQVALVDIGLPVMDGYEVARAIRAMPGFARLPLVAVTGYGQASDQLRVREAGFDAHLVKPLEADRIGALIENLVTI